MLHEYRVKGGGWLGFAEVFAWQKWCIEKTQINAQEKVSNWLQLTTTGDSICTFRDSAFSDDVAKTNLEPSSTSMACATFATCS